MSQEKEKLREELKIKIKNNLKQEDAGTIASDQLFSSHLNQFLKRFNFASIGAYAPLSDEPQFINQWADQAAPQYQLAYPDHRDNERMIYKRCSHQGLQSQQHNALLLPAQDAPTLEPDVVLVPGLAFSRTGHRLGRGQGHFDRYLINYRGLSVGVCFHFQLVEGLPLEQHDCPVDYLITEKEVIDCRQLREQRTTQRIEKMF